MNRLATFADNGISADRELVSAIKFLFQAETVSSQGFAPCKRDTNLHPPERNFLLNAGSAAKLLLWSFTGTASGLPSLSIRPLRADCSHCSVWITVAEKTAPNIFVRFMLIHFTFAAFCLLSEAASA